MRESFTIQSSVTNATSFHISWRLMVQYSFLKAHLCIVSCCRSPWGTDCSRNLLCCCVGLHSAPISFFQCPDSRDPRVWIEARQRALSQELDSYKKTIGNTNIHIAFRKCRYCVSAFSIPNFNGHDMDKITNIFCF